jgi:molybdenum cofactor cytidylyltransferase
MISAVVLAAGQSIRMGLPKMLLPWGQMTVVEKVISTLLEAGIDDLQVVTGGNQKDIEGALTGYEVNFTYNPDYTDGEMLSSVKVGLKNITGECEAALIVLGDQPQIETQVVEMIVERYHSTQCKIIVPSFQMHRGHPWLIEKELWKDIIALKPPRTLHDYLVKNQAMISYINVDTPSVIQDLDTPQDYQTQRP